MHKIRMMKDVIFYMAMQTQVYGCSCNCAWPARVKQLPACKDTGLLCMSRARHLAEAFKGGVRHASRLLSCCCQICFCLELQVAQWRSDEGQGISHIILPGDCMPACSSQGHNHAQHLI